MVIVQAETGADRRAATNGHVRNEGTAGADEVHEERRACVHRAAVGCMGAVAWVHGVLAWCTVLQAGPWRVQPAHMGLPPGVHGGAAAGMGRGCSRGS